jgi:general secretion pathway protein D
VPEAEQTKTEVFEVDHADPAEIVQVLRILLGEGGGRSSRGSGGSSRRTPRRAREERRQPSEKDKSKSGGAATSVVRGPSGAPIILIPDRKRKWIIARASPEDMEEIRKWILELDQKERIEPEYEAVPISYADVTEVATRLNEVLQQMPGEELQTSVLVQPLVQARQIVIYGRADVRDMVKKLIVEIDVPTGQFETKVFDLHHADPEQIKENIEDLYEDINADLPWWYRRYRQTTRSAEWVKVIAFPTMQQVTVIASPENMRKIEEQIKQWDVPIDVDKVRPLIISLKNTDPVKMADLLTTLFSEESDSWRPWWYPEESKKKIVGPLYGQLTFEEVPGTKKIIVVSKIPEAYRVVKEFVKELDKQEMAEIPRVVTLKYADPEDLAERLNAMFNEPGTVATIRFSETGLSEYSMEEAEDEGGSSEGSTNQGEYKPWWTAGRRRMDEMPISNVIGRIRFIPDPRTKSILVLSPPEFIDSIEDMIGELDVPGRQVRVKATILTVDHRDLTSLGLQLATNPLAFGALDEDAITALTTLTMLEERGSLTVSGEMSVTALIDFLVKKIDAKILNQQTLWTKDNEEADFFRGDRIAFTTDFSVSEVGGRVTSGFEFERVGMTLRVRPSITPEKNVDMTINIIISQLKSEIVNEQPVRTEMDTETTLIVQDGETIMLGGMLFQADSTIERKIPLFGDIPLLGGLFRHNEIVKANTEMLVFVTPYVIDEDPSQMLSETIESIESEREKLKSVMAELKSATERSEN